MNANDQAKVIFDMVHDIERCSQHFKTLKRHVETTSEVNPARKSLDIIEQILNKVLNDGINSIRREWDE